MQFSIYIHLPRKKRQRKYEIMGYFLACKSWDGENLPILLSGKCVLGVPSSSHFMNVPKIYDTGETFTWLRHFSNNKYLAKAADYLPLDNFPAVPSHLFTKASTNHFPSCGLVLLDLCFCIWMSVCVSIGRGRCNIWKLR